MVQFYLPPLRTQIDKICYFTRAFLAGSGKTIEQEAVDKLKNHSWEGNLRELQNCLIRACVLANPIHLAEHIILTNTYNCSVDFLTLLPLNIFAYRRSLLQSRSQELNCILFHILSAG